MNNTENCDLRRTIANLMHGTSLQMSNRTPTNLNFNMIFAQFNTQTAVHCTV